MRFLTSFLTDKLGPARRDLAVLALFFGIAFFQFLGRIPLIDPDEGRYAEIPREMLERGDFITPFLNYAKYFEKPPLHYWLNALSMSLFGQNEFAARLPGALCGLLAVLLVYHAGRRLFGRREAILAALILGTSTGFLVQARINNIDTTLTFCLSASLAFFILAAQDRGERQGPYYHLFYLFAALAVLAKGLIGLVFPGAIIFLFLLFTRRWGLLREMRPATGIPLFLAVAAPWFILVSLRNPEFARFFFIHEHFERFTTKVHSRYQPFWYFIPVLAGTMLPWSFFIPAAVRRAWRERKEEKGDTSLYLLIWAAFIFLFFSKSNSKLIPYILPVFPALALLMGNAFTAILDQGGKPPRGQAYFLAAVLTIAGAGGILYPHVTSKHALTAICGGVLGALFLGEGISAYIAVRRGSLINLFAGLCIFSYLFGVVAPPFILGGMAERKSMKGLGTLVREKAGKEAVVASFGLEQGLSYYTGRRIVIVGGKGELEFGSRQGDQSAWFIDAGRFRELWDSPVPVLTVLKQGDLEPLRQSVDTPVRILGQQGKRYLISNR